MLGVHIGAMSIVVPSPAGGEFTPPDDAAMSAANVNPDTGLATDYLNLFNEYVMLAELVADGSMERDILEDWQPLDYEAHFVHSNFKATDVVVAAFRSMPEVDRADFEEAVNALVDLILAHRSRLQISTATLDDIKHQRDFVAALISGTHGAAVLNSDRKQADIDAYLSDDYAFNEVCNLPESA